MGSLTNDPKPFILKDEPIENQRRLKVRVIGAGYSGIYLGIRIPQRLRNIDLRIYEKEEAVGGTWWVNRYPGCACDIAAHSYQYSFDPNPDWSAFYAPQKEICAYLHRIAEKYGVMRFVNLSHEILSCSWDDKAKRWALKIRQLHTGEIIEDDADVLVSARGCLSEPSWPDISGLDTFEGEIMHSALWKEGYDFENKRIGVIGNGSSAIQIVPSLQRIKGTQLSCFIRNPTWITNPFGDVVMRKLGLDPKKFEFSEEQRREFATNIDKLFAFRKAIETDLNTGHPLTIRGTIQQRTAIEIFRAAMKDRLSPKPEVADFLIPTFAIGCRRVTPGPGYLEALVEPDVDFITDGISAVNSSGVALQSGRQVDLDCLVCATGFKASAPPPFAVHGLEGRSLKERFTPYPEAYMSVAVDGFPNFFIMLGPNAGTSSGSLTSVLEAEGDYIVKCIRKLQKEDYASMVVKPARVRDWIEFCTSYFQKTVYTDKCNSWYKSHGGKGDRIIGIWPGSTLHNLEALRAPRWEDYEYDSVKGGENKMRWLGDGWSVTHMHCKGGGEDDFAGNPAWYLEPMFQSVPTEGRPEEDPEFAMRPFSH